MTNFRPRLALAARYGLIACAALSLTGVRGCAGFLFARPIPGNATLEGTLEEPDDERYFSFDARGSDYLVGIVSFEGPVGWTLYATQYDEIGSGVTELDEVSGDFVSAPIVTNVSRGAHWLKVYPAESSDVFPVNFTVNWAHVVIDIE